MGQLSMGRVGRIKELFNWIRELSNSITERFILISALSNCTHLKSSLIELGELSNWIGELSTELNWRAL